MNSKDKSIELVEKFATKQLNDHYKYHYAIECAIIAVDEILNVTREDPYPRKRTHMDKQYWLEVKQHLEEML